MLGKKLVEDLGHGWTAVYEKDRGMQIMNGKVTMFLPQESVDTLYNICQELKLPKKETNNG